MLKFKRKFRRLKVNPLKAELNPICHLLALLGGATIVVVSRLRVKFFQSLTTNIISPQLNVPTSVNAVLLLLLLLSSLSPLCRVSIHIFLRQTMSLGDTLLQLLLLLLLSSSLLSLLLLLLFIFLHGLGRLTCSGIDALPSFPGASTISSSSRFVVSFDPSISKAVFLSFGCFNFSWESY